MLTDVAVRNAKPTDKPYKLSDDRGLYLHVMPNGGRYWRANYRFVGKQKTLALGTYPDVSLRDARSRWEDARKLLAGEVDPCQHKKAAKTSRTGQHANSFEVIAREWFDKQSPGWVKSHADKIIRRLERDIFPWLGARPISEIKAPELLATLRRIEDRGVLETAHRALQNCGQVFRYALQTGRAERDPSSDLRGALTPWKPKHYPAVIDPAKLGELMRSMNSYRGGIIVKAALLLAPLVFVRPGELRQAKWAEINLDEGEWRYLVTKTGTEHLVPLSAQAIAILRELHPVTGRGGFVFPGLRAHNKPMSENTINAALRSLGFDKDTMTGHGFRAIARTLLDEVLGFRPELIEHQLAHSVRDPLGRAYNRTTHLEQRRTMMQAWADYLDGLKAGGNVLPFQKTA